MANLKNNHTAPYGVPNKGGQMTVIPPGAVRNVDCQDGFLERVAAAHESGAGHVLEILGEGYDPGVQIPQDGDKEKTEEELEVERARAAATLLEMADSQDWNEFRANAKVLLGEETPADKAGIMAALQELADSVPAE